MEICTYTVLTFIIFLSQAQSSQRPSPPNENPNPGASEATYFPGTFIPVHQDAADSSLQPTSHYVSSHLNASAPAFHVYLNGTSGGPTGQNTQMPNTYENPHFKAFYHAQQPHAMINVQQREQRAAAQNKGQSSRTNQPNPDGNKNNGEFTLVRRGDGTTIVGQVEGRLVGDWFVPFQLDRVLPLEPSVAARMHIRILTPESFITGRIKKKNGDLVFRKAKRVARVQGTMLYSELETDERGGRVVFTPLPYDVLVRNGQPYGQYDNFAFYPYMSGAGRIYRPPGSRASRNH